MQKHLLSAALIVGYGCGGERNYGRKGFLLGLLGLFERGRFFMVWGWFKTYLSAALIVGHGGGGEQNYCKKGFLPFSWDFWAFLRAYFFRGGCKNIFSAAISSIVGHGGGGERNYGRKGFLSFYGTFGPF